MAPEHWDADEAVTQLYAAHYAGLVRMAALLVRNSGEAEEIVQDAFVAMHGRWRRLREPERALGYLRTTVVNKARSLHRRHAVADRHLKAATHATRDDVPGADDRLLDAETRSTVLSALDRLTPRQREVLVLRYYSDLSEREIAAALGVSTGAVKSHASRGINNLRTELEELP
jgi:RNA polymerase sigma-70 factor (sigma-E family)